MDLEALSSTPTERRGPRIRPELATRDRRRPRRSGEPFHRGHRVEDARLATALWTVALLMLALLSSPHAALGVETAPIDSVHVGENERVVLAREILRIAVGDPGIASVQMISSREVLILGRRPGQTNLILWLDDGAVVERRVRVERDLSLLARAIADVHPAIAVTTAPDRDAVVLTGVVPDVRHSRAAEAVASDYLRGGGVRSSRRGSLIVGSGSRGPASESTRPDEAGREAGGELDGGPGGRQEDFLLEEPDDRGEGRLINLIRVDRVPERMEQRIRAALVAAGGEEIDVRRLTAGALPDDSRDTFVLEGRVESQVALVRSLISAARLLDPAASADQIEVVADEAGALGGRGRGAGAGGGGGGGATIAGVGTRIGGGGAVGGNDLQSNVARAKALSLADGQILSFLEVIRLPQVRLETRIYEVNRSRLRDWSPNLNVLIGNTGNVEIVPSVTSLLIQGEDGTPAGLTRGDLQGALSLLDGGTLLGGLQYVGDLFAIDFALDLLEQEDIARTLAKPTVSVLSGEVASFNSGGQIPIAVTVDTTTSATSGTLLSSTVFAEFGVNVSVRPLVSEDDMITLDVTPSISQPDFDLTADLVGSTGSQQSTTAFQTRSLRTTTRLRDGQSLVIGGLLQTAMSRGSRFTPWIHRIPGLGWLAKSREDQYDDLDFVVVLSPSIVYERNPRASLWAYPAATEILGSLRSRGDRTGSRE
ncbi:MAG: pilus assembly protein N-terminal domain-containing protein [bacterium]